MLKTKDHADHVGLSLPPDLLKELINSKTKNCYLSLNNNQLIVLLMKEIKDVTEDSWTKLSNTLKKTELFLNLIILIKDQPTNVTLLAPLKLLLKSALTLMFLKTLPLKWLLLYKTDLFLLLLMPVLYGSNSIDLEFTNTTVDFLLTTESQLLDTELITELLITKLKTLGDLVGE